MPGEKSGPWVRVLAAVFYPIAYALTRREVRGAERIPTGGGLLVLNHPSLLDPIVDAVMVHEHGRVPRFLTKHTLWRVPLVGRVLSGAGQIPVVRGTERAGESLAHARDALRAGRLIVIYPEGTLTADPDGWPTDWRTGVARLALDCDVPVVPAARWGTRDVLDSARRRFRPFPRKRVTMLVGEPIDPTVFRDREADPRELTDLIMARVAALLAEVRGERPPPHVRAA